MSSLNRNINHDQRKKIFALSRQANINNEELHHYIHEWANVSSLSTGSCTNVQAHKIIESLQSIVNVRKVPNKTPLPFRGGAGGGVKGNVTVKQIHAINTLRNVLKWRDPKRLKGFIEHTVGKSDVEDLNVNEASKVIIGLRKMVPVNPPLLYPQ